MATRVGLYHGDCLDVMPTLAPDSVDMVFADLPYGILKHRSWDVPIDVKNLWRLIQALGSSKCITIMTANMAFASVLVSSNLKAFRYDMVWQKSYASNFLLAKKRPLCLHENVLVFASPKHTYNPQMRPQSERGTIVRKPTPIKTSTKWHQSSFKTVCTRNGPMFPIGIIKTKEPRSGKIHPTQKPLALLEWLIKTYTNPGDTVLDPVSGSATTAIAAIRNGRNVICIEKDRTYFEAGVARVKAEIEASGADVDLVIHG